MPGALIWQWLYNQSDEIDRLLIDHNDELEKVQRKAADAVERYNDLVYENAKQRGEIARLKGRLVDAEAAVQEVNAMIRDMP